MFVQRLKYMQRLPEWENHLPNKYVALLKLNKSETDASEVSTIPPTSMLVLLNCQFGPYIYKLLILMVFKILHIF